MIPLPNEEATPPVTKMYFVSATIMYFKRLISITNSSTGVQNYKKKPNIKT